MMQSFCQKTPNSHLQVIFRWTIWAWKWSMLSEEEAKNFIVKNCSIVEEAIMDPFAKMGWNFRWRING